MNPKHAAMLLSVFLQSSRRGSQFYQLYTVCNTHRMMSKNEHCLQNICHPEGLHNLNLSYITTGTFELFLFSHTLSANNMFHAYQQPL